MAEQLPQTIFIYLFLRDLEPSRHSFMNKQNRVPFHYYPCFISEYPWLQFFKFNLPTRFVIEPNWVVSSIYFSFLILFGTKKVKEAAKTKVTFPKKDKKLRRELYFPLVLPRSSKYSIPINHTHFLHCFYFSYFE